MRGFGEKPRNQPLAMTSGDNPWGKRSDTPDADADTTEAAPPTDAGSGKTPPRNPWLPEAESAPARRSASIEDIFRARGPGGPANGQARGPQISWLPWVTAGAVAAWLLGTSVHLLGQGDQGLVSLLGRYQHTAGPGLTLTMPWPVQTITVRNTGKFESTSFPEKEGENLMLTRDRQLIDIGFALRWRVDDLRKFTFNLDQGEQALRQLADAQTRSGVAEMDFDGLWDGSRKGELQARIGRRLQAALDALQAGVKVEGIEISRADRPARLSEAFLKAQGARAKADKARDEATAWVNQAREAALNEAASFDEVYAQYQVAPEVTRRRMYYETMERVLKPSDKVIVAGGGVQVNLPSTGTQAAHPAVPPLASGEGK